MAWLFDDSLSGNNYEDLLGEAARVPVAWDIPWPARRSARICSRTGLATAFRTFSACLRSVVFIFAK